MLSFFEEVDDEVPPDDEQPASTTAAATAAVAAMAQRWRDFAKRAGNMFLLGQNMSGAVAVRAPVNGF
jgi:hypothetical protein